MRRCYHHKRDETSKDRPCSGNRAACGGACGRRAPGCAPADGGSAGAESAGCGGGCRAGRGRPGRRAGSRTGQPEHGARDRRIPAAFWARWKGCGARGGGGLFPAAGRGLWRLDVARAGKLGAGAGAPRVCGVGGDCGRVSLSGGHVVLAGVAEVKNEPPLIVPFYGEAVSSAGHAGWHGRSRNRCPNR